MKTYTNAIKERWLSSFPVLTVEAVQKHLPKLVQAAMGHLHMVRKGIRPTPDTKGVEINELMDSIIEPDIETQSQCCRIQIQ